MSDVNPGDLPVMIADKARSLKCFVWLRFLVLGYVSVSVYRYTPAYGFSNHVSGHLRRSQSVSSFPDSHPTSSVQPFPTPMPTPTPTLLTRSALTLNQPWDGVTVARPPAKKPAGFRKALYYSVGQAGRQAGRRHG